MLARPPGGSDRRHTPRPVRRATIAALAKRIAERRSRKMSNPNWAEQVTAIATAIGCIGLTSTLVLAVVAGRQVREAQRGRFAQLAADFIRRWNEPDLVETRRLVASFDDGEALARGFHDLMETNSASAYVLLRELDFYEQLGALDHVGAFDHELIQLLIGQSAIERWELWQPTIASMGDDAYPMFRELVERLHREQVPA
jgi:hypothetical protein